MADGRNQHPAVDHLRKFLEEEFAMGDGYVPATAFLQAYELWTVARGVVNRKLTPVELLDAMARTYGMRVTPVRFARDNEVRFVPALPAIRFRRDQGLSWRLRYPGAGGLLIAETKAARNAYEAERASRLTKVERDKSQSKAAIKSRRWYAEHREQVLARRRKNRAVGG